MAEPIVDDVFDGKVIAAVKRYADAVIDSTRWVRRVQQLGRDRKQRAAARALYRVIFGKIPSEEQIDAMMPE